MAPTVSPFPCASLQIHADMIESLPMMLMIVWFILGFNLLLIIIISVWYFLKRDKYLQSELESFCSELPRDGKLPDPFILKDGKWVERKP